MEFRRRFILVVLSVSSLLLLPACDGDSTGGGGGAVFLVKYEVTGNCTSTAAVGYTSGVGSTDGSAITVPWSTEVNIDTSGASGPVAVALAVTCLGSPANPSSITARLYVDGDLRDSASRSSAASISINLSAIL